MVINTSNLPQASYYDSIGLLAICDAIEAVEGIPISSYSITPTKLLSNYEAITRNLGKNNDDRPKRLLPELYPPNILERYRDHNNSSTLQHTFLSHTPAHLSNGATYAFIVQQQQTQFNIQQAERQKRFLMYQRFQQKELERERQLREQEELENENDMKEASGKSGSASASNDGSDDTDSNNNTTVVKGGNVNGSNSNDTTLSSSVNAATANTVAAHNKSATTPTSTTVTAATTTATTTTGNTTLPARNSSTPPIATANNITTGSLSNQKLSITPRVTPLPSTPTAPVATNTTITKLQQSSDTASTPNTVGKPKLPNPIKERTSVPPGSSTPKPVPRSGSPNVRTSKAEGSFKTEECPVCLRTFKGPKASTHKQQHIRRLHFDQYTPKRGGKKKVHPSDADPKDTANLTTTPRRRESGEASGTATPSQPPSL